MMKKVREEEKRNGSLPTRQFPHLEMNLSSCGYHVFASLLNEHLNTGVRLVQKLQPFDKRRHVLYGGKGKMVVVNPTCFFHDVGHIAINV
jgi:hypothetical protein